MFERLKPGRLLIELGVVVLGVGIALAADTWREDLELRDRELAYLRAIDADMEEATNLLKEAFDENSERADQTEASLALLYSEDSLPVPADWTATVRFSHAPFSIPTGTLQALIGSGDLGLVLSEDLRAILIKEDSALKTYQSLFDQAAAQSFPNLRSVTFEVEVLRGQSAISFDSYKKSPEIKTGYMTHLNMLRNMLSSIQRSRESVDNIHKAVEEELEQRGG